MQISAGGINDGDRSFGSGRDIDVAAINDVKSISKICVKFYIGSEVFIYSITPIVRSSGTFLHCYLYTIS